MEKHEFQPKEWVLTRDDDDEEWTLNIFSHKSKDYFHCVSSMWEQCLPYEGNEALLGTTDAPKEKHVWHAGDRVDVLSDFDDMWHPGFIVEIDYTRSGSGFNYRVKSECFKSIASNGKVWCKADQLRKPEEKPEEKDGWRPKEGEAVEALVDDEWQTATLILDDHTNYAPYRVRLQNGDKEWCTEEQVRPARKKPEEEEFKFGDKVKYCTDDDEWVDGLFVMADDSTIPYLVYLPDENDTEWGRREDVRRA